MFLGRRTQQDTTYINNNQNKSDTKKLTIYFKVCTMKNIVKRNKNIKIDKNNVRPVLQGSGGLFPVNLLK